MTETYNKPEREELSLLELNNRIKGVINKAFADTYWVRAEMSDVRTNVSGHCYLEFIEKNAVTGQTVAKIRASIWAKTFRMLKPYFEMETGQSFSSGLKVLVKVTIEFHELYGFSLNVIDIDPAYTLGDMFRRRMEIIRQLKEEGVFTLNKELPFPVLPQRIAIITSPTAAGYEDFREQLTQNRNGYSFYIKLFPAIMQGDKTEASIISAFDRINHHISHFDVAVIIRGGGATSDLNSFDSYLLAANCAQFPIPVITGIGHERDDTVLDMVAHTRMKTPTAVAEFLIGQMDVFADQVDDLQQRLITFSSDILFREKNLLQITGSRLPSVAVNLLERSRTYLHTLGSKLPAVSSYMINERSSELIRLKSELNNILITKFAEEKNYLQLKTQFVEMVSPDYILKKGYSLTLKDNKIIKSAKELLPDDEITTRFADGEVKSKII